MTWDALQRRSTDTPFLESAFLEPLIAQCADGTEKLALLAGPDGLLAATLVRPLGRGRWETFQPSQLPLGPWVAVPGLPFEEALHGLLGQLPGMGLSLGLTQLDPRLQAQPAMQPRLRLLDYVKTSYIDVAGSFDAYWDARGKNLRQNTRKQRNKLQSEGIGCRLECTTDPAAVPEALADYGRLESAGWKAQGGTAIHPDNAQGRFYGRMLQNFCAAGRGRIYRYRFGEQVVAMDLCIDNGPMVVILKTAYDESHKQLSPSTLMRQDQFRAWWDEGRYRRIEFYGKTLDWHTRWTDNERQLYHATGYRWVWLAGLRDRAAARQRAVAGAEGEAAEAAKPPAP
jgi:hypothetical protein